MEKSCINEKYERTQHLSLNSLLFHSSFSNLCLSFHLAGALVFFFLRIEFVSRPHSLKMTFYSLWLLDRQSGVLHSVKSRSCPTVAVAGRKEELDGDDGWMLPLSWLNINCIIDFIFSVFLHCWETNRRLISSRSLVLLITLHFFIFLFSWAGFGQHVHCQMCGRNRKGKKRIGIWQLKSSICFYIVLFLF